MGGGSSRQSQYHSLQAVNNDEQLSVWETLLSSGFNETSAFEKQHTINIMSTHAGNLKLRFFLQEFERWHSTTNKSGSRGGYGTRGVSLWITWECDSTNSFLLSVNGRKAAVNGDDQAKKDSGTWFHNDAVFIRPQGPKKILIEDEFLVLALLRKSANGEEKEKLLFPEDNGMLQLKVDFSVKLLFISRSYPGSADESMSCEEGRGKGKMGEGATYLVKDLKKLYSADGSSSLADVVLKSKDDMTFHVHKVILAARSPYFRRLMQWNPGSFGTKVPFIIDEVNGNALVAVLYWMYSGEMVTDLRSFLEEAIATAMKFEMEDLLKVLQKEKQGFGNGWQISDSNGSKLGNGNWMELSSMRKVKRAVLAWFPLLRYRFGSRPVGFAASIINAAYGLYELFSSH